MRQSQSAPAMKGATTRARMHLGCKAGVRQAWAPVMMDLLALSRSLGLLGFAFDLVAPHTTHQIPRSHINGMQNSPADRLPFVPACSL
eukprot:2905628-Rhodomonas_salina.1